MTTEFVPFVLGLALIDSLNPATIIAVTLILLAAPRKAGVIAAAAILGAALAVWTVGAALFLTAGAASDAVDGLITVLRFVAFGAGGVALIVAGVRRFRTRRRKPIALPGWFTAATALPFGVVLTAADLPNAFPYFIAIERMVATDLSVGGGLLLLAAYSVIYCIPCLILLIVGSVARDRTRAMLERVVSRFGTGEVKRSVVTGLVLIALGVTVGTLPIWLF